MRESISTWIRTRCEVGQATFSLEDVRQAFPSLGTSYITMELSRLKRRGVIHSPSRRFYVALPVHYARARRTPPTYYIDAMMQYLHRPYYIAALSAAELHGAAHQKPMRTFVMTQLPVSTMGSAQNDSIVWMFRTRVPQELLLEKNAEMGIIKYSNAELTALDLVQYLGKTGSISSVATILAELRERTNFNGAATASFKCSNSAAIQRLGYIYDEVLGDHDQADIIHREWRSMMKSQPHRINLTPNSKIPPFADCKRWLINVNAEIEVDDL